MKPRYQIHPEVNRYYTMAQLKRVRAEYKVHPIRARHRHTGIECTVVAYCKGYATTITDNGQVLQGWAGEFTIIQ